LEDNKGGLFSRKNMLALNEKALDLLNLLRGEIYTYLHFWIKCCDLLAQLSANNNEKEKEIDDDNKNDDENENEKEYDGDNKK